MTKEELKDLIRSVVSDMYDNLIDEESPANTTANVAGYDAPFGSTIRRKLKDVIDDKKE